MKSFHVDLRNTFKTFWTQIQSLSINLSVSFLNYKGNGIFKSEYIFALHLNIYPWLTEMSLKTYLLFHCIDSYKFC